MDVAILCPGPSFTEFLRDPVDHDLYLGVNRAAEAFACDWWVFNDVEAFTLWSPKRTPRIFTSHESWSRIIQTAPRQRVDEFLWLCHPQINTTCRVDTNWSQFTMCSAMVLAEHLGATVVNIYGCDWDGTLDFTGSPGTVRHSDRWRNEQHVHGHVAHWLCTRGVIPARIERIESMAKKPSDEPPTAPAKLKQAWRKHRVDLARPMQVGNASLSGGECVAVISCHPEASVNFVVDAIRGGHCSVIAEQ